MSRHVLNIPDISCLIEFLIINFLSGSLAGGRLKRPILEASHSTALSTIGALKQFGAMS